MYCVVKADSSIVAPFIRQADAEKWIQDSGANGAQVKALVMPDASRRYVLYDYASELLPQIVDAVCNNVDQIAMPDGTLLYSPVRHLVIMGADRKQAVNTITPAEFTRAAAPAYYFQQVVARKQALAQEEARAKHEETIKALNESLDTIGKVGF